jgi:hypothetical protein
VQHRPELRPALAAGERDPQRLEVPADRLQLAHDRLRLVLVDRLGELGPQLREARERLGARRLVDGRRVQDRSGEPTRLDEVVGTAHQRRGFRRHPGARSQVLVRQLGQHVRRPRPDPVEVEMHVVLRQVELLEIRPHRFRWIAGIAQRRHSCAFGALRQLLPVVADDEPVVDHDRRHTAEGSVHGGVQLLVRAMIGPADHMRDPEVDVVDDACEVERRRSVVAPQHHAPLEPLRQPRRARRLDVPLGALALPHRALVPVDPEPAQVVEDRLLPAGHVPRRIRVVDPQ